MWRFQRSDEWAQTWLPNLIAEAAGLLVAVVIVDQVLRFDRRLKERPLRSSAGRALGETLERIINLMVWSYAAARGVDHEDAIPASKFAAAWPAHVERWREIANPAWREIWAESLTQVVQELDRLVGDYREAFDPGDIAHIHDLKRRAAAGARAWIHSSKPLDGATQLVTAMQPVISIYERLAKSKLTTESGWATRSLGVHQLGL